MSDVHERAANEFEQIASQSRWVRELALAVARDAHAAEDASQDALLAALRRDTTPGNLTAWLRVSVRRLLSFRARSAANRVQRERSVARAERVDDPTLALDRIEILELLLREVRALEEPYRSTVLLRWFEGVEPVEIARRNGVPVTTVYTRIARGLSLLRERLDRASGGDRSRWLAAWIPLLPTPAKFWPQVIVMGARAKIAIAVGIVLASAAVLFVVIQPRTPDGVASIAAAALPPESPPVVPSAPSDLPSTDQTREPVRSNDEQAAAIVPPASARVISGIVIDVDSRAVPDVEVAFADAKATDPPGASSARSDARGRFQLERGTGDGTIVARGQWADVFEPHTGKPDPDQYVLVIARSREVHGRVETPDGNPVRDAGVQVFVGGSEPGFGSFFDGLRAKLGAPLDRSVLVECFAGTDKTGRFVLPHVPVIEGSRISARTPAGNRLPNGLSIRITGPGGMSIGDDAPDATSDTLSLPPADQDVVLVVHPIARNARLYGKVLGPDSAPVGAAKVLLGLHSETSEGDGKFSIEMDSDRNDCQLVAVKAGWEPVIVQCQGGDPRAPGAWPSPLALHLRAPTPSIRGRTVDREGNGVADVDLKVLNPVRLNELLASIGAELAMQSQRGSDIVSADAHSGADGSFEIVGLLPRNYDLLAIHRASLSSLIVRNVAAGSVDAQVVMDIPSRKARLAGRIVDSRGAPIAGAKVRARRVSSSDVDGHADAEETEPVTTDGQGHFQFLGVSDDVQFLRIEFEEWGLGGVKPLPPTQPRDALEIVVARIGHVRVEVQTPELKAERVCVLDQAGERLQITVSRGAGWTMGSDTMLVSGGRTEAFRVSEDARTLLLFHGNREVARIPIVVEAGKELVVRP
jgi:RNA polymerase sigma-70 factor (ECF subfamily)